MNAQTQADIAHLLRRFGLGASEQELDYYGSGTYEQAVDKLLNFESLPEVEVNPQDFANKQGTVNLRVMQGLWYYRLLATQRPVEEKLTLFWHNHFATSAQKVENAFVFNNHVSTLRSHALGNFRELVLAISRDPAMIYWLDNQENVKGKPNENFARELMELFTLGIGHYTEEDVLEASRAFTGWGYGVRARINDQAPRRVDRFVFTPSRHDDGEKAVLGKKGNLNGDDVIDHLCSQPQTARFIAAKMWEWFAYPNPEPALVERLARAFRDSDLNIRSLVRAIAMAPEFRSERTRRGLIKHPIDFVVSTARQLGAGATAAERIRLGLENPRINEETGLNVNLVASLASAFATRLGSKAMGMELMYPPDVSGWKPGSAWLTTATMVERIKWADFLFIGAPPAATATNIGGNVGGGRAPSVAFRADSLFGAQDSMADVVRKLASVFDVQVDPKQEKVLIEAAEAASGGRITIANAGPTARAVCRLMFGTPEFQFC
jgi:uncharacterized protein (DUF1800 family)